MPIWSMAGLSLSAALTAGCSCGATYATTSSERPAASSHLRSQQEERRDETRWIFSDCFDSSISYFYGVWQSHNDDQPRSIIEPSRHRLSGGWLHGYRH